MNWTSTKAATGTNKWWGVAYGNNMWVTVGTGFRAASPTGAGWATSPVPAAFTKQTAVSFANGVFVAVSSTGASTSVDGINWTDLSLTTAAPNVTNAQSLTAVTYGNGKWVMTDDRILNTDVLAVFASSDNGVTWQQHLTTIPYDIPHAVGYGNGVYIVAGYHGLIATSTDLVTWTKQTLGFPADNNLMSVAFANNTFVMTSATGKAFRSTDNGVTWTMATLSISSLCSVTHGGDFFVAAGGGFYTSVDGLTWTNRAWSGPAAFEGVAFGNNRFVAIGANSFAISQ